MPQDNNPLFLGCGGETIMHMQNCERLRNHLRTRGAGAALLSNPASITWLTGYAAPLQIGASPFEGGPPILWWRGDEATLLLSDVESGAGALTQASVRSYVGYSVDEPLACARRAVDALGDLLKPFKRLTGAVDVEMEWLPVTFWQAIQAALPSAQCRPLGETLTPLRAVKCREELDNVRAALKLCDLAHAWMSRAVAPGKSEIGLWGGMKAEIEMAVGGRVPILADLIGGPRTADEGGGPSSYILQRGDVAIFDISPRLDGYWGDSASTFFVGEPDALLARAYRAVHSSLVRGMDAIRPGARVSDIDRLMRESIRADGFPVYPHHSGHGIGCTYE